MKKFLAVMCVLFGLCAGQVAHAQASPPLAGLPAPESSRQACQDRADNDGDGHVDCDDQDCADFLFCARTSAYASDQPELRALRGKAATEITLGSILLSVGVTTLATSGVVFWAMRNSDEGLAAGVSMDIVGFAALVSGVVLIPMGIGHRVRATPIR